MIFDSARRASSLQNRATPVRRDHTAGADRASEKCTVHPASDAVDNLHRTPSPRRKWAPRQFRATDNAADSTTEIKRFIDRIEGDMYHGAESIWVRLGKVDEKLNHVAT